MRMINIVKKFFKKGYQNFEKFSEINQKFDLIISLHSLEHLTDVSIFKNFKDLLNTSGSIFFEVPIVLMNILKTKLGHHIFYFIRKRVLKKYHRTMDRNNKFYRSSYSFKEDQKFNKYHSQIITKVSIKNYR